jgi:hypothetical protein
MFSADADTNWWHTRTHSNLGITDSLESSVSDLCKLYFDFTDPTINTPLQLEIDPGEINVHYDDDLDLRSIHGIIKEKIVRILIKLSICDQEIYNFNLKIQSNRHAPIDKRDMEIQSKELILFKTKYIGVNLWEMYKTVALPILTKYTPLMSKEFMGNHNGGNQKTMDDSTIDDRLKYIKQYIDGVNKLGFLKIRSYRVIYSVPTCPSCMATLREDMGSEVNGSSICRCGFSESTVKHLSEYVDTTKSASANLATDINVKQIKQWLDRYLCRFTHEYDKISIFEKFDSHCVRCNLPNRFDVIRCNVSQPSMSVIITLLQLTRNTDLYVNKHQIRHDYYNYPKPILTDIQEATIIKLFVDFQNKYNEIKERKTSVHIEILACVFLVMVGININSTDFKIPISVETISYSHNSINDVLRELGYKQEQIPNVKFMFS